MPYKIWVFFVFVVSINSLNLAVSKGLSIKIIFLICACVLLSHNGYFVVEKLVLDLDITAFCYKSNKKDEIKMIFDNIIVN